ncbi:MAG: general transcription repressor [Chrysothrix sp. TS-e1954]|nr:MAG: general transcription repressor [Chrysothrix sp. TS-e1954]
MYNAHRGMMPQQISSGTPRLTELLDAVRILFDEQSGRAAGEYEQQKEIHRQAAEFDHIRDRIVQLESTHLQMKADYENRIDHLQRELERRGGPMHGAPQHPGQPQPPSVGHGPRDLFGGIMAGAGGAQGDPRLAPPPQEPPQHQGLPAHLTQVSGLNTGPQPPTHQPSYPNYNGPAMNGSYSSSHAGPPLAQLAPPGYPQGPPPAASPGPNKSRRPPHAASTPQQQPGHPIPYPPSSPKGHGPTPPPGQPQHPPPPHAMTQPHHPQHQFGPPPQHRQQHPPPIQHVGNELSKLNIDDLPPHFKKMGDDWWCIFNPAIPRKLDVSLVYTIPHPSVVCCVRFSHDGRYIATGCNHAAQIYDVERQQLVSHLEEENPEQEGDLYIRSVAFSPDGKYLATGAEDRCIRVWDIAAKKVVEVFNGHENDIYSLDFSRNGRWIASGSGDRTVRLWDFERRQHAMTMLIEEGVTTVALSPDGRIVAAGSLDRSVRIWDTETGSRIESLIGQEPGMPEVPGGGHRDSVYSVAFSPTGQNLVSGSLDKCIKMWDLSGLVPPSAPGQRPPPAPKGPSRCIRTFQGHIDFVLSVALSPDGQWVMSGSKDRGVVFWDPRDGTAQLHLQGHSNSVISVAPSPKGGLFATGSGDQKARIWSYSDYRGP